MKMENHIEISVTDWTPTIAKVDNGYIVSVRSPRKEKIIETYVYNEWDHVLDFLESNFEIQPLDDRHILPKDIQEIEGERL